MMIAGNTNNIPRGLLMRKDMTVNDLKSGMLVVLTNKQSYLVFGDRIVGIHGFVWLNDYTYDLKHHDKLVGADISDDYHIDEVYSMDMGLRDIRDILKPKPQNLIWKRNSEKEIEKHFQDIRDQITHLENMLKFQNF